MPSLKEMPGAHGTVDNVDPTVQRRLPLIPELPNPRGRPARKYKQRTRPPSMHPEHPVSLDHETPSPITCPASPPSGDPISPRQAALFEYNHQRPIYALESGEDSTDCDDGLPKRGRQAYRRRFIEPTRTPGWESYCAVPVSQLPTFFEKQPNDWRPKEYKRVPGITEIHWVTAEHGNRPRDLRARQFSLLWRKGVYNCLKEQIIASGGFQFRAMYHCSQSCCIDPSIPQQRRVRRRKRAPKRKQTVTVTNDGVETIVFDGDEEDEDAVGSESESSGNEEANASGDEILEELDIMKVNSSPGRTSPGKTLCDEDGHRKPRWTDANRLCHSQLKVEISSQDLGTAIISRKWLESEGWHDDAEMGVLDPSHQIRRMAVDMVVLHGMRPSAVKKNIHKECVSLDIPAARWPSKQTVRSWISGLRRRTQVAKFSFEALEVIARRNPGRVLLYEPYCGAPGRKRTLKCIEADPWGLDNALLHTPERGVALDSTWRGLSQNWSPLTFLVTQTATQRMVPIAAYISGDVKSGTLQVFLEKIGEALLLRAKELLQMWMQAGEEYKRFQNMVPGQRTQDDCVALVAQARRVLSAKAWQPLFWMIDKSNSELNAIRQAFPDAIVRVCQFNIIQAIGWADFYGQQDQTPQGRKRRKRQQAIRVPLAARQDISGAFRRIQRYRGLQGDLPFDSYRAGFEGDIQELCVRHGIQDAAGPIVRYLVLDEDLPLGQTRDGGWNTNNWIEAAFRVFRTTFLENRKNKRLDRLLSIIVDDFFIYYQHWGPTEARPPPEFVAVVNAGRDLWSQGSIMGSGGGNYVVSSRSNSGIPRAYIVDFSRPRCSYRQWEQTGKFCGHLWAVQWYKTNGPAQNWKEYSTRSQKENLFRAARACRRAHPAPVKEVRQNDAEFAAYLTQASHAVEHLMQHEVDGPGMDDAQVATTYTYHE